MNIPENHMYTISIDNLYFIIHSILKILILKLYNVIIFAFFKNLIKSKINLQKNILESKLSAYQAVLVKW